MNDNVKQAFGIAHAALGLLAALMPLVAFGLSIWYALTDEPVVALIWLVAAFLLIAGRELTEIRIGVQKLVKFEQDAMRRWGR